MPSRTASSVFCGGAAALRDHGPISLLTRARQPATSFSDRAAVVVDLHIHDAGKHPCNLVRLNDLQAELDVREHDIGGATRDDVDRLAILFPVLDPATGEFAPEAIGLDNEAAAVLIGKCGKRDLLRPP